MDYLTAENLLANSECIHPEEEVNVAVGKVAAELNSNFSGTDNVLILCVMKGGLIFSGQLLPKLSFSFEFDYLHVTRYGDKTDGGKLSWRSAPWLSVTGKTILIVDDILDEGITLAAVCERMRQMGANKVYTVVFADKLNGKNKPIKADFVGLEVADRFIFGFGMDIREAWRHLPAIYAYNGE